MQTIINVNEQGAAVCNSCGATITEKSILSAAGSINRSRVTHSRGPAKILSPCPFCAKPKGVAEMRKHKPRCKFNPSRKKRTQEKT